MEQTQNVALDSCVVIGAMESQKVANGLRSRLRGKSVRIVLCDTVLEEVRRVRGYSAERIIARLARLLKRKIILSKTTPEQRSEARRITEQYRICHNGDNKILSLCQAKNFILVTFDRMLLKACEFRGIVAFHPSGVGGI